MSFFFDDENYYVSIETDEQTNINPWLPGNTYECEATFMGVSTTFNITINESPIDSFTMPDITIIEGTKGNIEDITHYDSNLDEWVKTGEYFKYDVINHCDEISSYVTSGVTYDGWEITSNYGSTYYESDSVGHGVSLLYIQDEDHQWTVGNTYQVVACWLGKTTTFNVTIIESPIESFTLEDLSMYAGTNGNLSSESIYNPDTEEWEDFDYYWYQTVPSIASIEFMPGESENWTYEVGNTYITNVITGEDYYIDCESTQSYKNQFKAGETYTVGASLLGKSTTFDVTIKSSPIVSLEVDDVSITENTDGYESSGWVYNEETESYDEITYYRYEISPKIISIEFAPGESENWTYEVGSSYIINVNTGDYYFIQNGIEQSAENPLTCGKTYPCEATLFGVKASYNVTIEENPIESISARYEGSLIENVDGYSIDNGFIYQVDYDDLMVDIVYKNGKTATYSYSQLMGIYDSLWCSDNQNNEQWSIGGDNELTVRVLGYETTVSVNIVKSPIKDIEIVSYPTSVYDSEYYLAGNTKYYSINTTGIKFKVIYTDDSSKIYEFSGNYTGEEFDGYYAYIDNNISENNQWKLGKNTATLSYMGIKKDFSVDLISSPIDKIKITKVPTKEYIFGDGIFSNSYKYDDVTYYDFYPRHITGLEFDVYYKDKTVKHYTWEDFTNIDSENYKFRMYGNLDGHKAFFSFECNEAGTSCTVTLTYAGKTDSYVVNTKPSTVTGVSVVSKPTNDSVDEERMPDLTGMVIAVTYSDKSPQLFTIDHSNLYMIEQAESTYAGGGGAGGLVYIVDDAELDYDFDTDTISFYGKTATVGMTKASSKVIDDVTVTDYDFDNECGTIKIKYTDNSIETIQFTSLLCTEGSDNQKFGYISTSEGYWPITIYNEKILFSLRTGNNFTVLVDSEYGNNLKIIYDSNYSKYYAIDVDGIATDFSGYVKYDGKLWSVKNGVATETSHAHVFDDGVVTTPASCSKEGIITYTCDCGYSKTEKIPKANHSYGAWTKCNSTQHKRICENDPSHIEYASHTFVHSKCSVCGAQYGWIYLNNNWYYYNDAGKATGWQSINGYWYFFDKSTGAMKSGWVKDGTSWYYLNPSNDSRMSTGWVQVSGKWYYFASSGAMKSGWLKDGGSWYYLNPAKDSTMATGWLQISGKWYYFASSGAMKSGWLKDGGSWYYLNPAKDSTMATGWLQISGKWYYFASSGAMKSGWIQDGGKWYYMNPAKDSTMTTGWLQISGKWYYFNSSGVMVTGTQTIGGKTYNFNSSGVWVA